MLPNRIVGSKDNVTGQSCAFGVGMIGNGTVEARSIPQTLQAIDMLTQHTDLPTMYCDCIVKNKSIGIYDGAYKSVELATGKKFQRRMKA